MRKAKPKTKKAKLAEWFAGSISITLSTLITTTPLCAYYFESVSLVGIVTNLLTLWLISFIFYGIMAACVLGAIWLHVGKAIAWGLSWLMRYVLTVARIFSRIPMAAVYTRSVYIFAWLIFVYVLFIVFLRLKKKRPFLFSSCIGVVLCIAIALSYIEPRLDPFRISVLDVGQGQCILLQSNGRTYMVDCGGDQAEQAADKAAQMLLSQGITHLDGVILTHYDKDHADGAELLLQRINAKTLYLPVTDDENGMQIFRDQYADIIQWVNKDTAFSDADLEFQLFVATEKTSDNESSMCVLCHIDNCDILITGDRNEAGERSLVESHDLPELDVLVVGHHGAKTAASIELLHETKPKIAVISVDANNLYGHPAQDVLERLRLFECTIMRTDQMGSFTIKG